MTVSPRPRVSVLVATMILLMPFALFAAGPAWGQVGERPIGVSKDANPLSRPAPGGEFTYTVAITNIGDTALFITSLNDSIYGDLATRPGSTCGALIGVPIFTMSSPSTCTFTGTFTGTSGATLTDVVTAVGHDSLGRPYTGSDDATVTITSSPDYPLAVGPVLPAAAAPIMFSPAAGAAEPSGTSRLTASMGLLALVAIAVAAQVAAAVLPDDSTELARRDAVGNPRSLCKTD